MIEEKTLGLDELIPLTFDYAFAGVFNEEENMEIIESLIETYLGNQYGPVHGNIRIKPRDLRTYARNTKQKQLDVILDMNGYRINLEMNVNPSKWSIKRNTTFVSSLHGHQLMSGEEYKKITDTIQINFNSSYGKEKFF